MTHPPRGLKFALQTAALGYRVFPVSWPSRVPTVKDWPNRASTDPLDIEDMWMEHPNAVVGVATGPVFAVDLDVKNGRQGLLEWKQWCAENSIDVPDHAQETISGGAHVLYMLPAGEYLGNSAGKLGSSIDTRGYGGFIFAYALLPPIRSLPVAPEALLAALRTREKPERVARDVTVRPEVLGVHPYAERAIGYELNRLDECVLGEDYWDNTTFSVACNLVEFANADWSGYSLDQAHADFLKHAPVDGSGFPESRRDAKWDSAMQTVGEGDREEPEGQYLSAEEVFDVWVEETLHKIFDQTPTLSAIRQAAHSRMMPSGVVLANILGRVLADTPPGVVLPATISVKASLNLGFAMVGAPGTGKSAAFECGAEVLGVDQETIETDVGSGEGLIEGFLEEQNIPDPRDPTKTIRAKVLVDPPARIYNVDEVGKLGNVSGRDGSTMMSIIRTALTGGALKSSNATADRRRSVSKSTYRLVMFIGVQPAHSDVLLDGEDAGTPQRLLWIWVEDKTAPKEVPEWPGSLDWVSPFDMLAMHDHVIEYPDHIKEAITEQRFERLRGRGDPLDAHLMLTKLKVASAIAFLHNDINITDQWWTIAGHMMNWSRKAQIRCRSVLSEDAPRKAQSRGRMVAIEEDAADEMRMEALKKRITAVLEKGETTGNAMHKSVSLRQRDILEQAIDQMVAEGTVAVEIGEYRGQPSRKLKKI